MLARILEESLLGRQGSIRWEITFQVRLNILKMGNVIKSTCLQFKMMENALDTLKTAFPNPEPLSAMEDFEADGRTMDNRKYRLELLMLSFTRQYP